jgi:hypothetical protein
LLAAILSDGASATTYVLQPDGTGDFPTIQDAISACQDGDVVALMDGTYTGSGNRDIDFLGRAITVGSREGNLQPCVIDCEATAIDRHRAFLFLSGEGPESVLRGLTILHGNAIHEDWPTGLGGGVLCNQSSPTLIDCSFRADSSNYGGAFGCTGISVPTLQGCTFENNWSRWYGGAIQCGDGASPVITSCTFTGNQSGGVCGGAGGAICCNWTCTPTISFCTFTGGWAQYFGGAICSSGGQAMLDHCTLVGNRADSDGGAVFSWQGGRVVLDRCTLVGNAAPRGGGAATWDGSTLDFRNTIIAFGIQGIAVACGPEDAVLTCCDVYGNAGGDWVGNITGQYGVEGNISEDPLFCGEASPEAPYTLHSDSPCAPGANPECGRIGAWMVGCGAFADVAGDPGERSRFSLSPAVPNPFVTETRVDLGLAIAPGSASLLVGVYDPTGRLIRTLAARAQGAEDQRVTWDGRNSAGARVPPGVYFMGLIREGSRRVTAVTLLR